MLDRVLNTPLQRILERTEMQGNIGAELLNNEKKVEVFYFLRNIFQANHPSYRNQLNDLHCKSISWFLYDMNISLKSVRFVRIKKV